jgi:glycosyltransferase involved in cell wall biosynthesis
MAAAATFFLPSIHGIPTGGNIYNRRLITRLRDRMTVHVRIHGRDELSVSREEPGRVRIGIVDSLLLHEHERFEEWAREVAVDRLVLLVHYLHLADPEKDRGPEARRERQYLSLFDDFIGTSRYVRDRLSREEVSEANLWVVRPGLDAVFTSAVEWSTGDPFRILTVASYLPGKGLVEGVEAFEYLPAYPWIWEIVGADALDRDYSARLRRAVESSTHGERIDLVGPVPSDEIVSRYDAASIFFLPSLFETCSMVTMEAMSRGVPVVAFDVGGVPELIEDGVTGFLTERGAMHTAAGYIRALLDAPDRCERMGRAARRASERFETWEGVAERFWSLLAAK